VHHIISTWLNRLRGVTDRVAGRRGLVFRGGMLIGAYAATSAVVLVSAVGLGQVASPADLAGVLSAFFIITLSSGLEPGTTKALLVGGLSPNVTRSQFRAIALVSALKSALASLPLGLLWSLSDRAMPLSALVWLPIVVLSGFLATDFRVLLDAQGRHTAAIWLKQSSLLIGLAVLACVVALGASLDLALAIAGVVRFAWTSILLAWMYRWAKLGDLDEARLLRSSAGWFLDRTWLDFAVVSALAAVSGSLDRMVALRLLPPQEYNAYFVLYESMTKLWLLPYIAAPILFARRASGWLNERLVLRLYALIGLTGVAFVAGLIAMAASFPAVFQFATGLSTAPLGPLALFGLGIVVSSFTQLILIDLQARAQARWATLVSIGSLVVSGILFYALTSRWGLSGLLTAWIVKSLVELGLSLGGLRRAVVR